MILLTGGARSGKSQAAVRAAGDQGRPMTYIATASPSDPEMRERIRAHRDTRSGKWELIEEPVELAKAIDSVESGRVLVVDCLTLWVSNLMERWSDEEILEASRQASELAGERPEPTIVVTNEVGLGLVPATPVGRRFRDLQGKVNQMWAAAAENSYLVVAGRLLVLHGFDELSL